MMATAYERATTLSKVEAGRRKLTIDASWHTGRGAFGGLLAATALAAMREDVNDAQRIPRSLTLHFCAPAAGDLELSTEIVRVGNRITHAAVRFARAGEVTTFGSASFTKDRPSTDRYLHASMPDVGPPSSQRESLAGVSGVPAFFQHVDARFCGPTKPFSSSPSKDARVMAWVRLHEPATIDAPLAALLLDSLPPAISATFGEPRAVASVDFTIHLFARFPLVDLSAEEHCLVAIASRWAGDGYSEELREL